MAAISEAAHGAQFSRTGRSSSASSWVGENVDAGGVDGAVPSAVPGGCAAAALRSWSR
jgi:hypothetical protein